MSNGSPEVLGCVVWLGIIAASIASGILSFIYIKPESLLGILACLAIWVVVTRVAYSVVCYLVLLLFVKKKQQ